MFTGIVETIGAIESIEKQSDRLTLAIDLGRIAPGVRIGDSVAVAGVCLTVSAAPEEGESLSFEVIPESLVKTNLGRATVGDRVNLERAMSSGGRFDGHMVQGHVDGIGRVRLFDREQHEALLHVECDSEMAAQLVDKGSITIEGVSLTVVKANPDGFHVALIPHTLKVTTLSDLSVGDSVNLELDIFGKYVKQYVDRVLPDLVASAQSARSDAS